MSLQYEAISTFELDCCSGVVVNFIETNSWDPSSVAGVSTNVGTTVQLDIVNTFQPAIINAVGPHFVYHTIGIVDNPNDCGLPAELALGYIITYQLDVLLADIPSYDVIINEPILPEMYCEGNDRGIRYPFDYQLNCNSCCDDASVTIDYDYTSFQGALLSGSSTMGCLGINTGRNSFGPGLCSDTGAYTFNLTNITYNDGECLRNNNINLTSNTLNLDAIDCINCPLGKCCSCDGTVPCSLQVDSAACNAHVSQTSIFGSNFNAAISTCSGTDPCGQFGSCCATGSSPSGCFETTSSLCCNGGGFDEASCATRAATNSLCIEPGVDSWECPGAGLDCTFTAIGGFASKTQCRNTSACEDTTTGSCCGGVGGCIETTDALCADTWLSGGTCTPDTCPVCLGMDGMQVAIPSSLGHDFSYVEAIRIQFCPTTGFPFTGISWSFFSDPTSLENYLIFSGTSCGPTELLQLSQTAGSTFVFNTVVASELNSLLVGIGSSATVTFGSSLSITDPLGEVLTASVFSRHNEIDDITCTIISTSTSSESESGCC
jgi:hypothetical protein